MARLAIIENGVVVNVILGEPGFMGGVECAGEVGIGWTHDGEDFVAPELPELPPITPEHVKAEAARRINAIMLDYQQRNALALGMEAVLTYGPDVSAWPQELQDANTAIMAKWAVIKAFREASNAIEAMDPIPADFADDKYWT